MISAQDAALARARAYVRDRGWRHEPLTWDEVAELLGHIDEVDEEYFHIDDVIERIAQVKMPKAARAALASEFEVDPDDLTPRAVAS